MSTEVNLRGSEDMFSMELLRSGVANEPLFVDNLTKANACFDGALVLENLDWKEIEILTSSDDIKYVIDELTYYFTEEDKVEYLVK